MRQIVVLFFVVALLFTVAVEGQHFRKICQPYSVFKISCNTCRCSADGTDMACTKMTCLPNHGDSSEPSPMNKKKAMKMCEPGTYFKMDCNDCRCNEDGTNAACTLKACPPF